MQARIWAALIALVASLTAGGASATIITYAEGADLSNDAISPTVLGPLDIGKNTVAGSITVNCSLGICTRAGDFADVFSVSLPSGDEITSLSRVLLQSGAQAVISSLWKVSDQSTTRLMAEFHNHLRSGNSVCCSP